MARVVAFIPDLLFGSRVQGDLLAAGHEVELVAHGEDIAERLSDAIVLVIDLTDERFGGVELLRSLKTNGGLGAARTLGFYSHVDVEVRQRAETAGFDLVVPRSRMAREGAKLVDRLLNE